MKSILKMLVLVICILSCEQKGEILFYGAPTDPPGITMEMKTSGYWIDLIDAPDDLIMDSSGIAEFNRTLASQFRWNRDFSIPLETVSAEQIQLDLQDDLDWLQGMDQFYFDGEKVGIAFYDDLVSLMNLESLEETIVPQYGLIVSYANQRVLPSDTYITEIAGELCFDYLQMSALDMGTPVAVLAESKDGQWFYVYSPRSGGWVKNTEVGLCSYEELNQYIGGTRLVVTSPKASIYEDTGLTEYLGFARMGSTFPFKESGERGNITLVPTRMEDGSLKLIDASISYDESSVGYLAYTPRTIIDQSFKMLNQPYGWGGMYGEQDCSRYTAEVFATIGVILPRNSSWQGNNLPLEVEFKEDVPAEVKMDYLSEFPHVGSTLLRLVSSGHIAIYLGQVEDNHYIIHDTWGYNESIDGSERFRMTNKVVITPMSLGADTKKGTYWDRLVKIVRVIPFQNITIE